MSNRLTKLKRQKELIEEHLRWLEQEIVTGSGQANSTSESSNPASQDDGKPLTSSEEPVATVLEAKDEYDETEELTEQLISQYSSASTRGEMNPDLSLVMFSGSILGFIALVVFLFYWFGYC